MFWTKARAVLHGSTGPLDLIPSLQGQINVAVAQNARALAQLFEQEKSSWPKDFESRLAAIDDLQQLSQLLASATADTQKSELEEKTPEKLRFSISTLFLNICHRYLISDKSQFERAHLVTGPITTDGVRVLSQLEKVKFDKQSAVYVRADPTETHQKIVTLTDVDGHLPLAMFHGHNMTGADGTKPSDTDIAYQDRQAKIGCDAIGGIFSLDGYVRFFSTANDISVDVYGSGAKLISNEPREQVFKFPAGRV